MNQDQRLQLLLRYMIQRADDEELPLTATKVVKLLYLFDVEYYRLNRRPITGVRWKFYFYGPYSPEIERALNAVGLDVCEESGSRSGRKFRSFRSLEGRSVEIEGEFDRAARSVIDDQWQTWAYAELPELLSHVYFETEPMKSGHPMQTLDFSTIAPRLVARPLASERVLPADARERLRARMDASRADRERRQRFGDLKGPRLSPSMVNAYERAMAMLDREAGSIPVGLGGVGPSWEEFHAEEP